MKFLKVTPQLLLNLAKLQRLDVTGWEDPDGRDTSIHLNAVMDNGERFVLSRHKTFRDVEAALTDLQTKLEAVHG